MKIIYCFAVLSLFCMMQMSAQDCFREPYVKIGNTVLRCKKLSHSSYIVNNASQDTNRIKFNHIEGINIDNIKFKSQNEIHIIFLTVFSTERLKELSENERGISVTCYVNNRGELYQTYYSVNIDSKIKPGELVKLDSLMKKRLRFTVDEFEKTDNDILGFSQMFFYEKIISGVKIRPHDVWEYP